jgi:hypothetical protein
VEVVRCDRVEDRQVALVAEHAGADLRQVGGQHRAGHAPSSAVGVADVGTHPPVDAAGADAGRRLDHLGLGATEVPQLVHRVGTEIHRGAAGQREVPADVARAQHRDAERGLDVADGADRAVLDDLPHAPREWVVAVVERLHDDEAGAGGLVSHRLGLGGVGGEGLLTQHVLAGPQRSDRPSTVQPVGKRVVDGVDTRVVQQGLVAVDGPRDGVLVREPSCPLPIARRDGNQVHALDRIRWRDECARHDASRAEHTDPDTIHPSIVARIA